MPSYYYTYIDYYIQTDIHWLCFLWKVTLVSYGTTTLYNDYKTEHINIILHRKRR